MFFYLKDFSHTVVLAKKEHISFDSHDNFYCLIFAMYLGTTLLFSLEIILHFLTAFHKMVVRFENLRP